MATETLDNNDNIHFSTLVPTGVETVNSIFALGGDDLVVGTSYTDFIFGGTGNDELQGAGGDDVLLGEAGNDVLFGQAGDDNLYANDGNDVLDGGTGSNLLVGGAGNDIYQSFIAGGGIDTINDNLTNTGSTGGGGGTDYFIFADVNVADVQLFRDGDNLLMSTFADFSDGTQDSGVIFEDFYLAGDNTIEFFAFADTGYISTDFLYA